MKRKSMKQINRIPNQKLFPGLILSAAVFAAGVPPVLSADAPAAGSTTVERTIAVVNH